MNDSCFKEVTVSLYVHLHPFYLGNVQGGLDNHLNDYLMKYNSELKGVVLAYYDMKINDNYGKILSDTPYIHFHVQTKMLLFSTQEGDKIVGKVNHLGEDHIGLLVMGVFNASIEKSDIFSSYYFDKEGQVWKTDDNEYESIQEGQEIMFKVTRLHSVNDMLSIEGCMNEEGLGVYYSIINNPQEVQNIETPKSSKTKKKEKESPHKNKKEIVESKEDGIQKKKKTPKKNNTSNENHKRTSNATENGTDNKESVVSTKKRKKSTQNGDEENGNVSLKKSGKRAKLHLSDII